MSKKTLLLALAFAVMLISAIIGAVLVKKPWNQTSLLSESILLDKVIQQYAGEIISTRVQGGTLHAVLQRDTGQYELSLNRSSGIITSIVRLTVAPAPTSSPSPVSPVKG